MIAPVAPTMPGASSSTPPSGDVTSGRLPSSPDLASDGTPRIAPIGAAWNSPELRDLYYRLAGDTRGLQPGSSAESAALAALKHLWAADFAFRGEGQ